MIVQELVALLGFKVDSQSMANVSDGMKKLIKYAGVIGTAWASIKIGSKLEEISKEVASTGSEINKLSKRTGMATDDLQKWGYVARMNSTSTEAVAKGLRKLTVNSVKAGAGNKGLAQAFKTLGVNVKGADGKVKSSSELLLEVADGFANLDDESKSGALAMQVFGLAGNELLPMLRKGTDTLKEEMVQLEEMNGIMDKDLLASSSKFGKAQKKLSIAGQSFKNAIAKAWLPGMVKAKESMLAWYKANNKFISQKVVSILGPIGDAVGRIKALFWDTVSAISGWVRNLSPVQAGILKIAALVVGLIALFMMPLGPIIAIGAAIMLVLDDFQAWREGGVSVIGTVIEWFNKLLDAFPALRAVLKAVGGYFTGIFMAMRDTVFAFLKFFVDWWEVGFVGAFKRLGSSLAQVFIDIWDGIGEHIKYATSLWWGWITDFFSMLWGWIKAIVGAIVDVIVWPFKMAWWAVLEGAKALWNGLVAICTAIGAAFSAVWDAIVGAAKAAWDFVVAFIAQRVNNLIANFTWLGEVAMEVLTAAWNGIKAGFQWLWDSLVKMVQFYADLILAPFRGMMALWNAMWTDGLDGVLALLKEWAQSAIDFVLAPFKKVKEWIGKLFGGGKAAELEVGITRTEKTVPAAPGAPAQALGAPMAATWPAPMAPISERTILMARGMANVAQAGPVAFAPPMMQMTPARGPVTIAPQTKVEVQVNATPGMDEAKLAQQVAKQVESAIEAQNRLAIQSLTPAAASAR